VRSLKDGADLDGEGLAALVALIGADAGGLAAHEADPLDAATMRADRAFGPDARLDVAIGRFLIVEMAG